MKLAVVSHKLCWPSTGSPTGYATDGGFPFQIEAISELFDKTRVVVPSEISPTVGLSPMKGHGMKVICISALNGRGFTRKLRFPFWLLKNGRVIWREVSEADAVHTPIPGDIGTIGMLFALLLRKPLFVRHCGNWFVQRTAAERFWKWSMEYFGGGTNVMLATGGSADAPSHRNKNIKWIFSTSLRREQIESNKPHMLPDSGHIRLAIACRQEPRKGTDVVIKSMPDILKMFPNASLDVIGDGSRLLECQKMAEHLGLSRSVTFHGKLEHSEVLAILKQTHIFCFPTDASEGFPKAVLEALASGVPVITTRVSVLPELMKSGCGMLINSPSSSELAETVNRICSNKKKYHEMSTAAIETAKQYSLEGWKDRLGEILRRSWDVKSLSNDL